MAQAIENPIQGRRELIKYMGSNPTGIPADLKPILERLTYDEPSNVVATAELAELAYARADDLPPALLALAAECAAMCNEFRLHTLGDGERGNRIAKELRKRPGVTAAPAPAPTEPPEPDQRFKKPDATPAPGPGTVV